jgi:hypothetical protein
MIRTGPVAPLAGTSHSWALELGSLLSKQYVLGRGQRWRQKLARARGSSARRKVE